MIPPVFIYVRIDWFALPLPVVLLWPLLPALLVLAVLLLPLLPLRGTTIGTRVRLPFALWRMLAALRGLRVDLREGRRKRVLVSFW